MGRTAQISRATILTAGLAIADEHGLPAVTMQAVARRLRVTPMALYRHVANKDDLLDGLVERLLAEVLPPAAELPWHQRLTTAAHGIRATATRHPDVFALLLSRPVRTAEALGVRESIYAALREAGLEPAQIPRTERLLSTAILGFAASEAAGRFSHHAAAVRDADFACLLTWLRHLIDHTADPGCRR
ncbi:TetR/AcrR family transcriptional regulator [Virgisporangium aurantiacum]|uniref:TetR family transcriptional regulator n=1 Tax=Virgisporangium aurantiacum TaxID=175570 RepID=A0A8J3YZ85_9ACTN|nr:TetR/AcrR family transcriptional regulator [Virgisporangium aurantiacum]GIJ54466.1 TetR family transcriptional regulator [Virgisporangium aurantiacum]